MKPGRIKSGVAFWHSIGGTEEALSKEKILFIDIQGVCSHFQSEARNMKVTLSLRYQNLFREIKSRSCASPAVIVLGSLLPMKRHLPITTLLLTR